MFIATERFPYEDLPDDVSNFVQAASAQIRPQLQQTARNITAIGFILCQVKELLPHRQFGAWLSGELDMSLRTAERFMQVSRRLGRRIDNLSSLSADALYALSAPSTPETVIDDVVAGRIEPTPAAIRDEAKRRNGRQSPSQPTRQPWESLDALLDRYTHVDQRRVTAELLVHLAYSGPGCDWQQIEREVQSYVEDQQDTVRAAVHELAQVLSAWSAARA
jgi:hypothetical protein